MRQWKGSMQRNRYQYILWDFKLEKIQQLISMNTVTDKCIIRWCKNVNFIIIHHQVMWIIVRILLLQKDLKQQEQVTITKLFSLAVLHLVKLSVKPWDQNFPAFCSSILILNIYQILFFWHSESFPQLSFLFSWLIQVLLTFFQALSKFSFPLVSRPL